MPCSAPAIASRPSGATTVARKSAERSPLALDTNCLIALVCGWHEHHEATTSAVERRLDAGVRLALAAPALPEASAVLTRLPPPARLSPADALHVLKENFAANTGTVTL